MPSCLLYSLSHLILIQHFFPSNHLPLSLCHSISCIISPTSVTFLLFPSVFRFIPPRTNPPSHYLLPAGINLKYIYTDRSQIQSPKCILTWPRACIWWSQVELMQWPFPYCNLCMWLFHKIANTHVQACVDKQRHICHFRHAVRRGPTKPGDSWRGEQKASQGGGLWLQQHKSASV